MASARLRGGSSSFRESVRPTFRNLGSTSSSETALARDRFLHRMSAQPSGLGGYQPLGCLGDGTPIEVWMEPGDAGADRERLDMARFFRRSAYAARRPGGQAGEPAWWLRSPRPGRQHHDRDPAGAVDDAGDGPAVPPDPPAPRPGACRAATWCACVRSFTRPTIRRRP